jgi:hypothetical protein
MVPDFAIAATVASTNCGSATLPTYIDRRRGFLEVGQTPGVQIHRNRAAAKLDDQLDERPADALGGAGDDDCIAFQGHKILHQKPPLGVLTKAGTYPRSRG